MSIDVHPAPTTTRPTETSYCHHLIQCPPADAPDREAARVLTRFAEQGWSLLCNGVIAFDDTGEILPDGTAIEPHRGPAVHHLIGA